MKRIGIMQPYFLPYIGYFQLMNMVDKFVIYDSIKFSKTSWIRRNRMLQNGGDAFFTLPIRRDSDYLNIDERFLIDNFKNEAHRLLRRIEANYSKAPYYKDFLPVVEEIILYDEPNLFKYILNSVKTMKEYLQIQTKIKPFSRLGEEIHRLKSQDKVIGACKALHATHYINSRGGMHLYDPEVFNKENIKLLFFEARNIKYPQFNHDFVPFLSILDVCMFNDLNKIKQLLSEYDMIDPEERRFSFNESSVKQIQDHLWRVDQDFKPPLHTYINIDEYAQKLADSAIRLESFDRDKLISIMAGYYNVSEKFIFVSNFSIEREYRGQGMELVMNLLNFLKGKQNEIPIHIQKVGDRLLRLISEKNPSSHPEIKSIHTEVRNANPELIHFYKQIGFEELKKNKEATYLIKSL